MCRATYLATIAWSYVASTSSASTTCRDVKMERKEEKKGAGVRMV